PPTAGVVRAIHVSDGQRVEADDILIDLDPTRTGAEREHIQSDLTGAQLDIARLRAAMSEGGDPLSEFQPPDGATAAQVAMHRQYLLNQIGEHRAKLAALDRQRAQKEAENTTAAATIPKLDAVTPII